MSALAAEVEQTTREPSRPRLRLVPPVKARVSTFGFLLILAILVVLGMALVMVVTTQVGAQSRDLANLRKEATRLSYEAAARRTELQGVSSSGSLALRASELGMVPNPFPAFVDLSTGAITGEPRPVKGDEAPYLTGRSGAQQSRAPASPEPTDPPASPAPTEETTPANPEPTEETTPANPAPTEGVAPQVGEGER